MKLKHAYSRSLVNPHPLVACGSVKVVGLLVGLCVC